ncbi:sodium/solute symporter [Cellulophaga sp. F20128]|uniref:sodium:solute symporter family transporter n=1 Tax=Cellulophaga sp. F20128 TaxID=2926413 RepID=UPI001FF6DE9D|nr:sodium/solute symporter [Cellulophaga sp. F20128]MCK0158260.1 sodium/solute symporter [Cellulophaga sp. F20128]
MNLSGLDIIVFVCYFLLVLSVGIGVTIFLKRKQTSKDYFFAGNSLPWWVIGSSVIAANISAEQFIGMTGSGYAIGLGIATYEWLGAIGLLIVAKYFLPIYLKNGIYTMPGFLEKRYDYRLRISLAVFWLLVYWFVNLSSVFYLGALVLEGFLGLSLVQWILVLAVLSAIYAVIGGLKAVAYTDVIQVIFLVAGGLLTTYFVLKAISNSNDIILGLKMLYEKAPEKFDLILDKSDPNYKYLPGIGVILGGLWVANIAYFGCNQYIIQRSLAAKNIKEAQKGMAFAAFLKLFIPLIVVLPGIAAFVLQADIAKPDESYPWLLNTFIPTGFKGLAFAALIAAIVSSLSSMVTSASTIFTFDIYKPIFNKNVKDSKLVFVGRVMSAVSLVIAVLVAPLLSSLEQAFQFIQNFTGMVTPGIVVVFLFGLFWKKATALGALWTVILTIPVALILDLLIADLPFLDRMGLSFLILSVVLIGVTFLFKKDGKDIIKTNKNSYKTDMIFNVSAIVICALLGVLYYTFW